MHLVKITDEPLSDGSHRYYCPYCKTYLKGAAGVPVSHKCPDAGYTIIMNGFLFVDVPTYLKNERQGANKK